jgi:SAM-dependent methyltransferase
MWNLAVKTGANSKEMENDETLKTYNRSAKQLAKYFQGIGPRVKYIEQALELAGKNDGSAHVLELGCGDGRDAVEIIKRSRTYTGIDYSTGLIGIAKKVLPAADFRVADMQNFDYPYRTYDVVFAFASILHIDKASLRDLLEVVGRSLKVGGIFYISTKHAIRYKKEWKEDEHGKRLFYFYSPKLITNLSKDYFEVAFENVEKIKGKPWTEIALRKK